MTAPVRRALSARLAPLLVLVLGVLLLIIAVDRLDRIYSADPGILQSRQVSPGPIAVAHASLPGVEALRGLIVGTSLGMYLCAHVVGGSTLCVAHTPQRLDEPRRRELEQSARTTFGRGTPDVTVASWPEPGDRVVVAAVALFANGRAAEAARDALPARGVVTSDTVAGSPAARTGWLEGSRMLVGVLVTGRDAASARVQLASSVAQVSAYLGLARVAWFEAIALLPLLALAILWTSARLLALLALAIPVLAAAALSVVALLAALVGLIVAVVVGTLVRGIWRGSRGSGRPTGPSQVGAGAAQAADLPRVAVRTVSAADAARPASNGRVVLIIVTLIVFGIALLTRSLFPGSLVWGSAVVVAAIRPPIGVSVVVRRLLSALQMAVRVVLLVATAGLLFGLAPPGIAAQQPAQLVIVGAGALLLGGHWTRLTTGTKVSGGRRFEDVDARSVLFVVGAAAVLVGAGTLFLASNGEGDGGAQAADKVIGAAGLFVASTVAVHVRASRDAAARARARRRGLPYVLYLRSFGDDTLWLASPRSQRLGLERFSWHRRELFEDVVARAFGVIGPVVAIARPGTEQHDLGAAHDSIAVEDWLSTVRSYMVEAALVVVTVGNSAGLIRELGSLGELGLLDRACLLVPPLPETTVAERLAVLGRDPGYSAIWGAVDAWQPTGRDVGGVVALTTVNGERVILLAGRRARTAADYRAVAAAVRPSAFAPL